MTETTLAILIGLVLSLAAGQCAFHVLRVGATRAGKTQATAADIARSTGAELVLDPHKDSLAQTALVHATGNVLYCKLSDIRHSIGFDLITPSTHPDSEMRALENHLQAENFVQMLLLARDGDLGPLQEEWLFALLQLYLNNANRFPPSVMPSAFLPASGGFRELMKGAREQDRDKFLPLAELSPKGLRAEVGSTYRLVNGVFGSPIFSAWSRGGFPLGDFYRNRGKLIVERGDETGDATMRLIMGAISLQTIKVGVQRAKPEPAIRIRVDEMVNAGLDFHHLIKATAETAKNGVFVESLVQNLNFRNKKADEMLQNCLWHEWFRCPLYSLAREAAVDVLSGLRLRPGESRAERLAELTDDIQNLEPGWRWVRGPFGARKEYVPMLEHPWPDWPGLRKAKMEASLCEIYSHPAYRTRAPQSPGAPSATPASTSASDTLSPASSSPDDSSPAERWKRGRRKPPGSSPSSDT